MHGRIDFPDLLGVFQNIRDYLTLIEPNAESLEGLVQFLELLQLPELSEFFRSLLWFQLENRLDLGGEIDKMDIY